MKKLKNLTVILIIFSFQPAMAQIMKGMVRDETSFNAVASATITAAGPMTASATTNADGKYSMRLVPGLYQVIVEHPDFKSESRSNILIGTKQQEENFSLKYYTDSLSEITVSPNNEPDEITETKMHRYAAAFYDPARLINTNAAAINTNDQANHFSVRGTSPNFIQWKVDDVEIVNPNHLENAGTANDRPSANGGGVSMISAQLLSRSPFLLPIYKPSFGNALTGIFNIMLRSGNNEKAEHIAQASFLGLDISTEGPVTKNKSSYLINARYSTIGLLSEMGVDFGGEKTSYKDLSGTLNFKTKRGELKFFTMTGASSTTFKGSADTSLSKTEKDFTDISYQSFTAINGLSFITGIGNTMFLKAVGAFSLKQTDYKRQPVLMQELLNNNNEKYENTRSSALVYIGKRIQKLHLTAGSYLNYFANSLSFGIDSTTVLNKNAQPFIQPFAGAEYHLTKFIFSGGIHSIYQFKNENFILLPNAKIIFNLSEQHFLSAGFSQQAQIQNFIFYSTENLDHLKPAQVQILNATYNYSGKIFSGSIEAYTQTFSHLPENPITGFNSINYFNEHINFPLYSSGTATVTGIDVTLRFNYKHFYAILSSSFLKTSYPFANTLRATRYDPGENYFLTAGKEWSLKNNRFFTIDVRSTYRKGFRQSDAAPTPTSEIDYNLELPDYFRTDFRISFRKSKTRTTTLWALDIQNVTGKRNVGYYYYDKITKKSEAVYQLGLIPVLSYKLFF